MNGGHEQPPKRGFPEPEASAFTETQRRELHAIIQKATAEAMAEALSPFTSELRDACRPRCVLNEEQQKEIGHLFGVFRDVGGRDVPDGIERLRGVMAWYARVDALASHLSKGLILFILIGLVGTLGTVVTLGLRQWLLGGGK